MVPAFNLDAAGNICVPAGVPITKAAAARSRFRRIVVTVEITVDGVRAECPDGLTVAGALQWLGIRTGRTTSRFAAPRGLFCGMGVCFDCVMVVDGRAGVRVCVTPVRDGMTVEHQSGCVTMRSTA